MVGAVIVGTDSRECWLLQIPEMNAHTLMVNANCRRVKAEASKKLDQCPLKLNEIAFKKVSIDAKVLSGTQKLQ